ncbi:hypothetical protein ACFQ7M_40975, partial [Streptomyces massasporeus]
RSASGSRILRYAPFRASPREMPASGGELMELASGHSINLRASGTKSTPRGFCVPPERNGLVLVVG